LENLEKESISTMEISKNTRQNREETNYLIQKENRGMQSVFLGTL
jgi:hypothetical protein